MATLNQSETQNLSDVMSRITFVRNRLKLLGEKPGVSDEDKKLFESLIEVLDYAYQETKVVKVMKGYYPK
jgi:hypothetical protein